MATLKVRMQQASSTLWERILLNPKVWTAFIAVVIAVAKEMGWEISTELFTVIEAFLLVLVATIKGEE